MRPPGALPLPLALLTAGALLAATPTPGARAARILGLFPTPSISHQLPLQAVMKELAARGHQITVISTDPLKEPVANYTDIDLSFSYEILRSSMNMADMEGMSGVKQMEAFLPVLHEIADAQLSSPQIQDFLRYNASQGYDMVFLESLMYQSYYGIVHAVGSPPLVGMVSLGGFAFTYNAIGNPNNPAYNPEILSGNSDHMTFWDRLQNTYSSLYLTALWNFKVFPQQETLLRKHFGPVPPSVYETEHNMSLVILCNHWSLEYPRALLPNVVQLTGLHVREEALPLPTDLQAWIDGAEHGVIYFSLGRRCRKTGERKGGAGRSRQRQAGQAACWRCTSRPGTQLPADVCGKQRAVSDPRRRSAICSARPAAKAATHRHRRAPSIAPKQRPRVCSASQGRSPRD